MSSLAAKSRRSETSSKTSRSQRGGRRPQRRHLLLSHLGQAPEIIAVDIYGAGLSSQREASARRAPRLSWRSQHGRPGADRSGSAGPGLHGGCRREADNACGFAAPGGELRPRPEIGSGCRCPALDRGRGRRCSAGAGHCPIGGAVLRLAVFSSLLLRNRRNGNAGGCNCRFRSVRQDRHLGRWPLVRNGLLLLLASLVARARSAAG